MSCYEYPYDCGVCPHFRECFFPDDSELDDEDDLFDGGDD